MDIVSRVIKSSFRSLQRTDLVMDPLIIRAWFSSYDELCLSFLFEFSTKHGCHFENP